eukprot:COSAG01_NODE_2644_length_7322_cov_10.222899_6_plen_99_part_00
MRTGARHCAFPSRSISLGQTVGLCASLSLSEPARVFSVFATDGDQSPPVNFQAGMQQPGILQPAEADSTSIGRRRFTEQIERSQLWLWAMGRLPLVSL